MTASYGQDTIRRDQIRMIAKHEIERGTLSMECLVAWALPVFANMEVVEITGSNRYYYVHLTQAQSVE